MSIQKQMDLLQACTTFPMTWKSIGADSVSVLMTRTSTRAKLPVAVTAAVAVSNVFLSVSEPLGATTNPSLASGQRDFLN